MQSPSTTAINLVRPEALAGLPEPVRRYAVFTGLVGKPWITSVRLEQTGRFRQKPGSTWMPVEAVQFFTTDPPGFQWRARFKMFGLPLMAARDTYKSGTGHMYGKMAGLFTIFDERGPEMDQGTMLRYLGEAIWFPTAFFGPHFTWQPVDEQCADITFTDHGKSVTGRFSFDSEGRPIQFAAQRYGDFDGEYLMRPWIVPMTEFALREGLMLPVRGQVKWRLPAVEYSYYDWEIGVVEYNQPIVDF